MQTTTPSPDVRLERGSPFRQRARTWLLPIAYAAALAAWTVRPGATGQSQTAVTGDATRAHEARPAFDPHAGLLATSAGAAAEAAPFGALSGADPRTLCLAPVSGASRTRRMLRASMAKAHELSHRPDAWVDVGHAWLRELRSTGDSGYALHARACAEVAREIAPDDARALALIGSVYLDGHEFRAARELAEQLLARNPDDSHALAIASDAALELGDVTAASSAAQRLLDRAPGLGAYARGSHLRWLHGDETGAIELARAAIDAAGDPDELEMRAWMLVQAAHLFWQRGDHEGAEAGYRMALDVRSEHAPALLGLGKVAAGRGDYREAADLLARALSARPDVETAAWLGQVSERLGDAAGAAQKYALAEQLGRHDRRSLALFYADRRREPARAVELMRAELGGRGDIYCEDALAWALYANGELAEAEQHAERALRLGTRDALLLYHLGAIRLARGKTRDGKRLLERALQQNPRFDLDGADEARRLLSTVRS